MNATTQSPIVKAVVISIACIVFASCKRDYTCSCTIEKHADYPANPWRNGVVSSYTTSITYKKMKKGKARDKCLSTVEKNSAGDSIRYTINTSCALVEEKSN